MVKVWVKQNNRNNSMHRNNKGGRARSARAPLLFVPAVASVVLFDPNLDKKIDPNLDQAIASREKNPVKSCDPQGAQEGGASF